jgi:hypothetical protein
MEGFPCSFPCIKEFQCFTSSLFPPKIKEEKYAYDIFLRPKTGERKAHPEDVGIGGELLEDRLKARQEK